MQKIPLRRFQGMLVCTAALVMMILISACAGTGTSTGQPATAVLSDFGGNAQAIGNNVAVKVKVQFPAITVVSVGNPNM